MSVIAPASSRAKNVGALAAMIEAARDQQQVEHEQDQVADQAELLGEDGEDEVGVRSGMKSRWACVPSSQPLPSKPPEPTAIVDWMMW